MIHICTSLSDGWRGQAYPISDVRHHHIERVPRDLLLLLDIHANLSSRRIDIVTNHHGQTMTMTPDPPQSVSIPEAEPYSWCTAPLTCMMAVLRSLFIHSYGIFHPTAPNFLLSRIKALKKATANSSFLKALGREQFCGIGQTTTSQPEHGTPSVRRFSPPPPTSYSSSLRSRKVRSRLARRPLGGSLVILIPVWRMGTGNLGEGLPGAFIHPFIQACMPVTPQPLPHHPLSQLNMPLTVRRPGPHIGIGIGIGGGGALV